jgi:peptidyl-prolyl cis-trans isomerase A (cyclophilin A)
MRHVAIVLALAAAAAAAACAMVRPSLSTGPALVASGPKEAGPAALRAGPPRFPRPTSPDPTGGRFSLAEATAGLGGRGQLVATLSTTLGDMRCRLHEQQVPSTVANFVGLARGTRPFWDPWQGAWVRRPYYDGLIFHRVIPGFMIQGGCPLGRGSGSPGYTFADEIVPALRHARPGVLSMANAGPGTNGSQFFITLAPTPHLDGRHTVFGSCEPLSIVERIARVDRGPGDRPVVDVVMRRVEISRAGR